MRLEQIDFTYRSPGPANTLFSGLSRDFEPGVIHAVIGGSGCGKTTLLYLLSGLLAPDRGRVELETDTSPSIILQGYGLFPWKRVRDNVALGLRLRGEEKQAVREKTESIMEELGIAALADAYPARISGGERQRVAIARAVVLEPEILLMDEPFSSLDAMNREKMQELLLETHRRHAMSVILVTHSIEEAAYLSGRIHVMRRPVPDRPAEFLPVITRTEDVQSRRSKLFHEAVDTLRLKLGAV